MAETFTLKTTDENGDSRELEMTPEQTLDLRAGKGIAHFVDDEAPVIASEDGTFTTLETAVPNYTEERPDDDPRD